jgi:hypothetical protein
MDPIDIRFDSAAGPIVVQVRSGNATRGRFKLLIEGDLQWTLINSGDLSDAVPDVFVVPVSGARLHDRFVLIVGNYAPGNVIANEEINVTYDVTQQSRVIHSIPIREQRDGVLSSYHLLRFVKA